MPGRQDAIRGVTPRRTTVPPPPEPQRPSDPELESIIAHVVGQLLGQRTAAEESMIAASAGERARRATRGWRLASGGLGAALVALASWSWSQVQAYGDGRAAAARAAIVAESKAEEAAAYLEETRRIAEEAGKHAATVEASVRGLEAKMDRVLDRLDAPAPAPVNAIKRGK